ncbi:hypothetical protein HO173_007204 [Letharia columbiana]|uniref:Sequence orphan n=1 Tax=Letharia columbiana TaxID=112416 RepID=A0A8H6FTS0_9LECA|nr:uncharacterized protein HO173_007204 [Letharia columbiana]KAF6234578.1 hypothetical protein HO173_007204 [Letharia columbiana]
MTRELDRNGLAGSIGDKNAPPNVVLPPSPPDPSAVIPLKSHDWNTKNLPWRITCDVTAAACASGLVSPWITIIDRAIIENASNRSTLRTSIRTSIRSLLTRPHLFLTSKPALLISTLYFGTYATANSIDTVSSTVSNASAQTTTTGPAKFLATTSVNMSLCLYKDSQFARLFGPPPGLAGAAARTIPKASYALFAARDSLTIFASFNLPPLIAPWLPMSEGVERSVGRLGVAQFLAPAGMQLFSTPLHLWGLDLYNRPTGSGARWRTRVAKVGRDWLGSSLARMGRIVPAFGVGGVVNSGVRSRMMGMLEG